MNASRLAQSAYSANTDTIRTEKSVEFEVIARITHRLKKAIISKDFSELARSIHENRVLWNTLAADVLSDGNKLPNDVKANILYLQRFVEVQSRKILREKQGAKILLEVNAAILGGLKDKV